jgi:hypothetical protein
MYGSYCIYKSSACAKHARLWRAKQPKTTLGWLFNAFKRLMDFILMNDTSRQSSVR